ncbi:MAG: sigma 54-interacting transcriptional regulator [Kofleriaceae bacterium]
MPSLRLSAPGHPPLVYSLHPDKKLTSIGSGPDNDIVLPDPLVQDGFAIRFDGQLYTLLALKKTDFVVNGKKRGKHKMSHDDRIVIGSCELRFQMLDEVAPTEPEAAETIADIDAYTKLYEFSERLIHQRDLGELLDALMDAVVEITNADKGFLVLLEGETIDVKVARNLNRENIADAVTQLSDSIIAKVVRSRKPVIVSDAMRDDEFAAAKSVMQLKVSSVICVPLLDRGRLLGLIYVGNDSIRDLFQQDTLRVLTVFASQASLIVANALLLNELRIDNKRLHERLEQYRFGEIVGSNSSPMQQVFRKVEKIAATDISVLITGETGTGKELIAREIHNRSPRVGKPFVTINCGAIPGNLLESELFGHVKGAFTGAVANKQGKFQAADGGTLFLDEVGEMPIELQVKLLRAIQEKVVFRVGDTRPETCDIRIVAATNRELEKEIVAGRFREDLYYRLNVVNVELPPLRARGDDVIVIARYLLSRYAREYDSKVKGLSQNASVAIRKHNWPGNIRELENRIKKAIVLCESTMIGPEDLGLTGDVLPQILTLADAKEKFQRDYINEVLALNNGNRTKTARDLGVDPRTVFRHLEKESDGTEPDPIVT